MRYDTRYLVSHSVYKRIDHAVYRAERSLVVASLLVMAVVVFLDVVHRSFSGEQSKFAMAIAKLGGWFGVELVEGTPSYQQLVDASPWALLLVFTALTYFGIRSVKRDTPVRPPIAVAGAVGGVLAAYGCVRLLLVTLPNGLIWSQTLALVLTLWVGFIGASMCTYENRHLRVEAVQRFLPEAWRPTVGFLSGLMTALVCTALLWLSLRYVLFTYEEYVATDGKGGIFMGMALPKYVGFAALPVAFGFMTIRFSLKAIGALRGEVEIPLDPVAAAGGLPTPDPDGRMPSEVATEAFITSGDGGGDGGADGHDDGGHDDGGRRGSARPSVVETMNTRTEAGSAVPRPQSKVPTDAHDISVEELLRASERSDPRLDPDLDPDRTRELDDGPIAFADETRELDPEVPR